jgi:sterol desaturase/sphingolipid hydroxylase (fatty acid hydroxylase superfamily)
MNLYPILPGDILLIIILFLYISLTIYISHRFQQHKLIRGLSFLYQFHTVEHHSLFDSENIEKEQSEDTYMILFPPLISAFLVLIFYPMFVYGFFLIFDERVAWLYYLISCSYYFLYELIHYVSHTHKDNMIRNLPIVFQLAENHRLHHDPKLMNYKNFGIVTTLWDHIFSTKFKK